MVGVNDQEKVVEISEYGNIYQNEDSHFFYTSTHYLVEKLIRKYAGNGKLKILDAGCGTGGLMVRLSDCGKVVGIDHSSEAVKYAKKRRLTVKRASINKLPFRDRSFDLVICIDVIYHLAVTDDVAALGEIGRVLKPGGVLILRVPANKFLLSAHDIHVHTARRYSKIELASKLRRAGFKIKFVSYVHAPIFPLSLIRVLLEKLDHRPSASTVGWVNPIINMTLTAMLKLEAIVLARGIEMPFGQGLVVVATPNRQSSPGRKRR